MKQDKIFGVIAILIVVTIYGVSYIARDVLVQSLNPIMIVALQLLIMAILFTGYNLINKIDLKIDKRDILLLVLSGLFGTSFFHILTTMSVQYIGGMVSSLLSGFAAVFALLIEFILFKRKKTKLSILSVVVSLIGVYILIGIDFSDLANANVMGYFVTFLSIISWVIFCFLSGKISDKYEKTVVLNYQAIVGLVTTLPFLFIFPVPLKELLIPNIFMNLIFLGLINSTIAYFLTIYAIQKIGVTFSNLFLNFIPVVTILVGLILYGTIPGWNQLIGGMIIIASVLLLNKDQNDLMQSAEKLDPQLVE